jgi:Raf kinase inhibitor-like YbhB/YbcL family protein
MRMTTDAFDSRGFFDPRYTGDFDNSSPELRWEDVPEGTAGFALIAEDPDAPGGTFAHWVVHHIPPNVRHLPAGIPTQETLPNGIRQGTNGFGKLGYGGPYPPVGDRPHRYFFRLFALRAQPEVPSRVTREELLAAISSLTLATAELMGKYQRVVQRAG